MAQNIEDGRAQLLVDQQVPEDGLAQLNRIAIALTSEFDLQRLLQMTAWKNSEVNLLWQMVRRAA